METHGQERRNLGASETQTVIRLVDAVEEIETREDVAAFVEALWQDLQAQPNDWENPTLDRYLAALASRTEDMDEFFANRGKRVPTTPSWRLVGQMLLAAKVYD